MNYPQHVAIIPDGNRTWAKENGKIKMSGHLEGFKRMVEIAEHVFTKTPIKVLTVWWLSTENLKNRESKELSYLFDLYIRTPQALEKVFKKNNVKFKVAGDIEKLPQKLQDYFAKRIEETKDYLGEKAFVLAVNYGGQDEIVRGVNKMIAAEKENIQKNELKEITKEKLSQYLDFGDLPNVDLVIRTKGAMAKRLSGFMLWWLGYAQLYFTEKKCPDLMVSEFNKSLEWYDSVIQYQNFGK